jgi:hypothetical protein
MEAVSTSETSVDNHFTRQYIPEDNSEHICPSFNTHLTNSYELVLILCVENNLHLHKFQTAKNSDIYE